MKVIRVNRPKDIEIAEAAMPNQLLEEEVLIKVKAAGICGSDLHIFHGTNPFATYPRIIGHEFAGEIVEVGTGVEGLKVGDHVVVDPVISCGSCYPCRIGRPNICTSLKVRGVHTDGGFCEYVVIPAQSVYRLPPEIPWPVAVLTEPFSIAAQVLARGKIASGDTVLILGAGPIGLTVLQVAKMEGAQAIIADIVQARLDHALHMGADLTINTAELNLEEVLMKETVGLGVTVVVEAVGLPKLLEDAVKVACPAARVVVLGFTKAPSQVAQYYITRNELDIKGSRLNAHRFPQVIEWFINGQLKPELLVSHTFNIREIDQALRVIEAEPEKVCKVVLLFD